MAIANINKTQASERRPAISTRPPRIIGRTQGRRHGPITRLMSPGDLGELLKPPAPDRVTVGRMGQGLGGVSCPNQRDAQSDLGGERPFRRGRRGAAGVQARRDRPYRLRRCGSGPARLQSARRHGGDRGRQEIVARRALQRVSRPHRRFLLIVALGYAVGWPALGWFGALAAALTAYVRVFGGSLGFAQDFRGPMAKQQRMAVLTAACVVGAAEWLFTGTAVCPDCGRGRHRRRLGRDVRHPHARHRRQAQGKLACGCRIILIGSVRALLGATPRWIGSQARGSAAHLFRQSYEPHRHRRALVGASARAARQDADRRRRRLLGHQRAQADDRAASAERGPHRPQADGSGRRPVAAAL